MQHSVAGLIKQPGKPDSDPGLLDNATTFFLAEDQQNHEEQRVR